LEYDNQGYKNNTFELEGHAIIFLKTLPI